MFLIIIALVICILYFITIAIFYIGWKKVFSYEPKGIEALDTMVSVVVACRNEKDTILPLIAGLAQQSYQNFELILVNDHSTDTTRKIIKSTQENFPKLKLIDAVGFGKKNALKEGILQAKSEFIITTDADCMPSYHWLESIFTFQKKYPSDLVICPVGVSDGFTVFSRLQALEFVSLVGAAAGSAGVGMPILCNGANLAFRKSVWLECQEDLHFEQQSGDDIFLLESIKKRKGIIRFIKSEAAFIKTKPSKTLHEFLKQRRRWAGKSNAYTDWQIIATACIVFSISLLTLVFLVMSAFNWLYIFAYLALFVFKFALDVRFLYLVRRFFQLEDIWMYALLLSIVYPFYIVSVAVTALVRKPIKWK